MFKTPMLLTLLLQESIAILAQMRRTTFNCCTTRRLTMTWLLLGGLVLLVQDRTVGFQPELQLLTQTQQTV